MERIVYIRGKFKGNNKEMKEAYFYAKEMMKKYDLEPQYIGVIASEGWKSPGILTIKRKEKQLLEDLEKNKKIESIEVITKEMEGKEIIDNKSYFLIDKEDEVIAFWTNTNILLVRNLIPNHIFLLFLVLHIFSFLLIFLQNLPFLYLY